MKKYFKIKNPPQPPLLKGVKNQKGFGIAEVLVSISILIFGLVGVLSLANQNIRAQRINRNSMIASHLAQEGIELVRNTRDTNWLAGNDWKLGDGVNPDTDIFQDGTYSIDYTGDIFNVEDIFDPLTILKLDPNKFYQHSTGDDSMFSRIVTVVDNDESINISVAVSWNDSGNNYTIDTILYNWR